MHQESQEGLSPNLEKSLTARRADFMSTIGLPIETRIEYLEKNMEHVLATLHNVVKLVEKSGQTPTEPPAPAPELTQVERDYEMLRQSIAVAYEPQRSPTFSERRLCAEILRHERAFLAGMSSERFVERLREMYKEWNEAKINHYTLATKLCDILAECGKGKL